MSALGDRIGQLKTANAQKLIGVGVQSIEQQGYGYDASWNLGQRRATGTTRYGARALLAETACASCPFSIRFQRSVTASHKVQLVLI